MALVTVVVPARTEGPLLAATLQSLASVPAGADFDVVVVDDGSRPPADTGGGFGLPLRLVRTAGEGAAGARNTGAARSRSALLCFCDAHLAFPPGWLGHLVARLEAFDAVSPGIAAVDVPSRAGFGFTWDGRYRVRWLPRPSGPAEVPMLPGGCLAIRREALCAVGGFDAGLAPWGHEDAEISWALWLAGFRCGVDPEVSVAHHFRSRHPYPVFARHVDRNLLRLGRIHFGAARLERLRRHLQAGPATLARVEAGAARRRVMLAAGRVHDDDWLCARFALPI